VVSGTKNCFQLTILNRGLAPAYQRFRVQVKLERGTESWIQYLPEIDNRRWLPDSLVTENCSLAPASELAEGEYSVKIRMRKENGVAVRPVWFALDGSLRDENGFYQVGSVYVKKSKNNSPQGQLNLIPESGEAPLSVFADASDSTDPD